MNDVLDFVSYWGGLVVGLSILIIIIAIVCILIVAFTYKALFSRFIKHDITPEEEWRERYYDEIV